MLRNCTPHLLLHHKGLDSSFSKMPESQEHMTGKRRKLAARKVEIRIPLDIITEILAKLPAISLLRLRYVCKAWHSIIQDQNFISLHMQNSALHGLNIITWRWVPRKNKLSLRYFVQDWHKLDIIDPEDEDNYYISNSCNGLICVYAGTTTYVVNPSIREVQELPEAPEGVYRDDVKVALAHDAVTGEYKIVRIFRNTYNTAGCTIFTLGSSSWRFIGDAPLPITSVRRFPVVANANIYWKTFEGPLVAVSFDIKNETFDTVMPPEGLRSFTLTSVCELGGYLCLLESFGAEHAEQRAGDERALWTLKDYRNNRWTKHIIDMDKMEDLSLGVSIRLVLLGVREGKILTSDWETRFDLYDPVTGCFGKPLYLSHGPAVPYIESLISPIAIQSSLSESNL